MLRLRLGILLIILSWLPFAQVLLIIAHDHHKLTSSQASTEFRLVIWGLQVIVGLVGLWLAGKIAMQQVKKDGWKRAPGHLWYLLWNSNKLN